MVTAERAVDVVKLFAPIVIGVILIVIGLLQSSWATFGAGAGLLGVPGISEALRGNREEASGAGKSAPPS